MIAHYDWSGGREAMIRFGPENGPVVIVALPLFEEANRTRGLAVAVLRLLAEHGIAGAIPDLPGQGESMVPTRDARLADLRGAFASAAATIGGPAFALSIRSGALIDADAALAGRWHLSPLDGPDLVRELRRAAPHRDGDTNAAGILGNDIDPELIAALDSAHPAPARIVRMDSDPRDADRKMPGAPLWRRAEPGEDPALAAMMADDIAQWVRSCAG